MPANTQHPDSEWARVKPIIEDEYLNKNRSAKAVQALLRDHHGFDTTVRKLKLKFELWRWDKKTNARNYAAMSRVIQHLGNQVVFVVPKMGGRSFTRKEACKVLKEARRKDTTNLKRGKPAIRTPDIDEAWHILQNAGIIVEQPQSGPMLQSSPPLSYTRGTQHQNEQSDDDDDSTVSDESVDDTDFIADSSRQLNLKNFPPHSRFGRNAQNQIFNSEIPGNQRVGSLLPFESAFLADLHRTIFPHTAEYQLQGPNVGIVQSNRLPYDVTVDSAFEAIDFVDAPGRNPGYGLSEQQRAASEKVLATALREHYQRWDQDGQRRQVLEFSAYYVGQFLTGNETLDDYNHADRQEARNKLYSMLEHGNTHLLPHCYWLSQVVISFDKSRQLLAFYEDCIDCIETSQSVMAKILQPWIRSVVLLHRDLYKEIVTKTARLSPASLDQLQADFDATSGFETSIDHLRRYSQEDSHTCLILRIYHAWYQGHRDRHTEGLSELLKCLPLAEKIFGKRHLVTINCLSMAARAYEKLNNPLAEHYVQEALHLLTPCSRFLQATYHQLLLRLARSQISRNHLEDARCHLELVYNFRLQHFGAQAFPTWEAAKVLFDVLNRQGHGLEAKRREADLQALHDEEWKRYPVNRLH